METGTLKELNVKPGDVVEVIGGKSWEIVGIDGRGNYLINDPPARHLSNTLPFRIISRATDTPKLWRDMTDAEKGALLLAHHEGKVIQYWDGCFFDIEFSEPGFYDNDAYRVKPEPVRSKVEMFGSKKLKGFGLTAGVSTAYRITFETVDGKPDCSTIKMEELE
jgi:hypothetical protein